MAKKETRTKSHRKSKRGDTSKQSSTILLQFDYKLDDDYRVVPVTGVVGHVMPGQPDSIFASLWVEHLPIPEATLTTIVEGRQVKEEHRNAIEDQARHITRRVSVSLVITREKARSIGDWLIKKADESDAAVRTINETRGSVETAGGSDTAVH